MYASGAVHGCYRLGYMNQAVHACLGNGARMDSGACGESVIPRRQFEVSTQSVGTCIRNTTLSETPDVREGGLDMLSVWKNPKAVKREGKDT